MLYYAAQFSEALNRRPQEHGYLLDTEPGLYHDESERLAGKCAVDTSCVSSH